MIVGLGIDIVDMKRLAKSLERWGDRFAAKFCTDNELEHWKALGSAISRLAGRFAAKEAAMKALGVGWGRSATWKDFEITNNDKGDPSLAISGSAARTAEGLAVKNAHISIAHSERSACAVVVLEA